MAPPGTSLRSEGGGAADATLGLRVATPDDAAQVAAIYAPYVTDHYTSFELVAPDAAEMRTRIETTLRTHPWLVAEQGGALLGYAYACAHRTRAAYQWSVDVAIYLRADAQRQRLGRRLYGRLFAILCRQGYINAYAGIALPNAASVSLHEMLGFSPVGVYREVGFKHGAPRDVGWWQLQLAPWPENPAPPVPFAEIAGNVG